MENFYFSLQLTTAKHAHSEFLINIEWKFSTRQSTCIKFQQITQQKSRERVRQPNIKNNVMILFEIHPLRNEQCKAENKKKTVE